MNEPILTAEVLVNAPIKKVWELWTLPEHIKNWNSSSDEWHTPKAENDLRIGGKLFLQMEGKDGSEAFDYSCTYDEVITNKKISHTGDDKRKTMISFVETEAGVKLTETFEPNMDLPLEMQQAFCQSILNNFKLYAENI